MTNFTLFSSALVHPDNQMLGFLAYNPVDAMGAIELAHGEFLLVFNTLGVYVDVQGRKSRDREIMYPAVPTDVAVCDGKLLVYSETHIDVFDTVSGDWVQSINIRKTRPLVKTGMLNLSMLQEMPHVTYLSNIHKGEDRGFVIPNNMITSNRLAHKHLFSFPLFRGHPERFEAVADDDRPRRSPGAKDAKEIFGQGEQQADQGVSTTSRHASRKAVIEQLDTLTPPTPHCAKADRKV